MYSTCLAGSATDWLRIDTGEWRRLLYASSNILLYKLLICVRCYYIDNYKPFLLMYSIF